MWPAPSSWLYVYCLFLLHGDVNNKKSKQDAGLSFSGWPQIKNHHKGPVEQLDTDAAASREFEAKVSMYIYVYLDDERTSNLHKGAKQGTLSEVYLNTQQLSNVRVNYCFLVRVGLSTLLETSPITQYIYIVVCISATGIYLRGSGCTKQIRMPYHFVLHFWLKITMTFWKR